MASTPASRKAKGRNFQYFIARRLAKVFGIEFDQQDDLCPIHSREMGQSGADVFIREREMHNKFPFDIECKNQEKISLYAYIRQAEANTTEGRNWLIFHKKNHSKPIAVLDAEVFFQLIEENLSLKERLDESKDKKSKT